MNSTPSRLRLTSARESALERAGIRCRGVCAEEMAGIKGRLAQLLSTLRRARTSWVSNATRSVVVLRAPSDARDAEFAYFKMAGVARVKGRRQAPSSTRADIALRRPQLRVV